ncbi:NagC-like transcriptional regulator of glucosamine ABC transporter and kinase cluster [Candidatus Rhodobacter oscarellae]|uniref:NagC-like transcriptional regulator of glucosamine ABC transporter and kinase cluster n=1 Tax=Candidatus Rhodobacter oscarellae TaxID=1675527 RepID=A0A0J9E9T3_9RHOB|nr:ROK family transcriptional regulator [Candidatus Rhodobacter lobularis]KMW59386.1 NagC-like transcriptional regulator of glucosamine ABC transporter and kinase cluster [Candidatus Rhodobacter lobularis]
MITLTESVVGANAGRSRGHNRQVVLGRIRSAERIGRAEIARASGLSTQAVSNIIADLLADGLIVEGGHRAVSRGVPVVQYALNPQGAFAAGIEIRPDAVFGALLNFCGELVVERRRKVSTNDRDGVIAAVRDMQARIFKGAGCDPTRLLGLGIVMPGPFGCTGIEGGASELPIWDDTPPEVWLSERLGQPVLVENDANAAAIAERVSGAAQGLDSYGFLYFGVGLGLGMVHRGRLQAGAYGNAGEIGTLQVPCDGKLVMLEDVVSRRSLSEALRASGAATQDVGDLARLYEAGDPALHRWLERTVEPLSAAISIVENLFDPQTIILGGAMPDNILDHMTETIRLASRSVSNRAARQMPRLMRGASGRMTATLGAAALVVNHAFTPKIAPQPQEL